MIQDPQDKIHNCQVIHYSRRNPYNGIVESDINWMRTICTLLPSPPSPPSCSRLLGPWDKDRPDQAKAWHRIVRHTFTNSDLLGLVAQIPQEVNNYAEEMDELASPKKSSSPRTTEEDITHSTGENNATTTSTTGDAGIVIGRPRKYSLAEF
jgi:hypothetical protein